MLVRQFVLLQGARCSGARPRGDSVARSTGARVGVQGSPRALAGPLPAPRPPHPDCSARRVPPLSDSASAQSVSRTGTRFCRVPPVLTALTPSPGRLAREACPHASSGFSWGSEGHLCCGTWHCAVPMAIVTPHRPHRLPRWERPGGPWREACSGVGWSWGLPDAPLTCAGSPSPISCRGLLGRCPWHEGVDEQWPLANLSHLLDRAT